jgi:hypothetical protein
MDFQGNGGQRGGETGTYSAAPMHMLQKPMCPDIPPSGVKISFNLHCTLSNILRKVEILDGMRIGRVDRKPKFPDNGN